MEPTKDQIKPKEPPSEKQKPEAPPLEETLKAKSPAPKAESIDNSDEVKAMAFDILLNTLPIDQREAGEAAIKGLSYLEAKRVVSGIKAVLKQANPTNLKPAATIPVPSTQGMKPPSYYDPGYKWVATPDPRTKK